MLPRAERTNKGFISILYRSKRRALVHTANILETSLVIHHYEFDNNRLWICIYIFLLNKITGPIHPWRIFTKHFYITVLFCFIFYAIFTQLKYAFLYNYADKLVLECDKYNHHSLPVKHFERGTGSLWIFVFPVAKLTDWQWLLFIGYSVWTVFLVS